MTNTVAQYTIEVYEKDGRWYGKLINNNAKPFNQLKKHYRFRDEEQANRWAEETANGIKAHEARKAERRKARSNFENPAKVGDILYSSWGYDQTNIDFYQVTEVKNKSIVMREISKREVESTGWMQGKVMPNKDSFVGEELLKRVRPGYSDPEKYDINLNSYSSAWKWDGEPKQYTAYA